jgi:peptidoglycan/LPS O-acetylase OafA/YrhL
MNLDLAPAWLKALAASLWVAFVLAPLVVWLQHHFGDAAILAAVPTLAVAFAIFRSRLADEDISDAEYYRRKAKSRRSANSSAGL